MIFTRAISPHRKEEWESMLQYAEKGLDACFKIYTENNLETTRILKFMQECYEKIGETKKSKLIEKKIINISKSKTVGKTNTLLHIRNIMLYIKD